MTFREWEKIKDYPSRRLVYAFTYPFISVEEVDRVKYDKNKTRLSAQLYPMKPLRRKRYWEGFPGFGWSDILKNTRVVRLRKLNGTPDGLENARRAFIGSQETLNIMLTLLASVEAAALTIPGIETAHWLTRAFWLGGTAIAVCGVLTGAMIPGAFHIFFGEDIDKDVESSGAHRWLTLETNAALVHEIDGLFSLPTLVITWAGALFIAGIVTFAATVTFEDQTTQPHPRGLFATLMLAPGVVYMAFFWYSFVSCSIQHRQFRNAYHVT